MIDRTAPRAVAVIVDPEDRVVSWSRGAERLLGYAEDAVLGQPMLEALDGRDVFGNILCRNGCWLREMWRRGEPVRRFEIEVLHADGHRLRLLVEAEPAGKGGDAGWAYWLASDQRRGDRRRVPAAATESLPVAVSAPEPVPSLTQREIEVLRHLGHGADTPAIARALGISRATVRNHVQHLLGKLGAHNRLQVVSLAHRYGLL